MSRRSGSSKQSERSKPENRTQESESDSGDGVDISPDEININAGAVEIGINTEGELSLGIEIPTPVPGVTATGGIVIDTATGEITEISVGAEIGGVTGVETTLKGCNVVTTFYVEVPGTNIRFSYNVISELPNCKIEEEEEEKPPEDDIPSIGDPDPVPTLDEDQIYILFLWYNSGGSTTFENEIEKHMGMGSTTLNIVGYEGRGTTPQEYRTNIYTENFTEIGYGSFTVKGQNSGKSTTFNKITGDTTTYISGCATTEKFFFRYPLNLRVPSATSNTDRKQYYGTKSPSPSYADCSYPIGGLRIRIDYGNNIENYINSRPASEPGGARKIMVLKIDEEIIAVDKKENPKPQPQPPRKMDKCCKESLKLLEEIHKALGCEELLDKKKKTGGFEVPRRLMVPGGRGEIKHHNYLEILESLFRTVDHLGIHPFEVKIKDLNAAQAGNQSAEFKFLSGTAALEKIVYLLTDTESDGDVHTNMLVRLAFVCTNILTALSTVSRDVETVRDGLGVGFKSKRENVEVPFDVSCGQSDKGFDPKKKKQIDFNEEESTEQLLPYLLRVKKQGIRTTEFSDTDDIKDLLIKILYSLKGRT